MKPLPRWFPQEVDMVLHKLTSRHMVCALREEFVFVINYPMNDKHGHKLLSSNVCKRNG